MPIRLPGADSGSPTQPDLCWGVRPVYALSIHADYRCRHSGECCSANWDVPVELPIYRSLREAVAAGTLVMSRDAEGLEPFVVGPDLPEEAAAMFERTARGACVFLDRGPNLCIVHRDLGERALPVTCRHFPRIAVRDARGTSIALSHFCPTAASMLFRDDVPVTVVEAPIAFPPADYDGLTVGLEDLPPLLTPRMLMDNDGFTAWERHMVARAADLTRAPESVLATLTRDARLLAGWTPGGRSLVAAVHELPPDYVAAPPPDDLAGSLRLFMQVMAAVPDDFKPEPDEAGLPDAYRQWVRPVWLDFGSAVNRYIAAKAFASWTAYQGRGVATIVRGIEAAVALVRVEAARQCRYTGRLLDPPQLLEAFRDADFALNHLAVGEDLAEGWSEVEAGS
jgi:Fe-S-cluster containining protein